MNPQDIIGALIYDQLGKILKNFFGNDVKLGDLINIFSEDRSLLEQLLDVEDGNENKPPKVTFGLIIDIVGDSGSLVAKNLTESLKNIDLLPFPFAFLSQGLTDRLQSLFQNQLEFFGKQRSDLITLVISTDAGQRKAATQNLSSDFFNDDLKQLVCSERGAIFSLATIESALQGSALPVSKVPGTVQEALLDYFFNKNGYQTIDGSNIISPVHISDVLGSVESPAPIKSPSDSLDQLKSLFSKPTAENYVRDVIRVIVEAAYDSARGLKGKYADTKTRVENLKTNCKDKIENKFVNWFRGFSAMGESTAMHAVETVAQGVSMFQTNTLIAAAAGTFAGTVARKFAQDAFMDVLQSDLRKGLMN